MIYANTMSCCVVYIKTHFPFTECEDCVNRWQYDRCPENFHPVPLHHHFRPGGKTLFGKLFRNNQLLHRFISCEPGNKCKIRTIQSLSVAREEKNILLERSLGGKKAKNWQSSEASLQKNRENS
ncbi:hypothetical protein CEXT_187001 [Caerostris extrusa]|uniref:Uncharacterized protein n=1 Tax=Caerostris extrusa TaxID=172846 RepID=A0AAV4S044_CAEEX|nr:hypothetical protein CEXT_187001 [Caerostris extrusa]